MQILKNRKNNIVSRMESDEVDELLSIFNVSASGGLTKQEVVFCWAEWIKKATQTILQ